MPAGIYSGSVAITPSNGRAAGMGVIMIVSDGGPPPAVLSASATSLAFTAPQGGSSAPQSIMLYSSTGPAAFTLAASTKSGGNWLSTNMPAGNTPVQVTVSVNPQGLAAGTYSGSLVVTPLMGTAMTVPVTLTVAIQ
jgi:hypothetical protein